MLIHTKKLFGHKLAALDGDIGHIKDFYFDDRRWVVRYMIADTGTWLAERLVLLSPHSFGHLAQDGGVLNISLTKAQIENSPSIDSEHPVSRQYETDYYRYYGWPAYWDGGEIWGIGGYPARVAQAAPVGAAAWDAVPHHTDDRHLRSVRAITDYSICATDGAIGNVSGLTVNDRSWSVHHLVVDVGHWYSAREVLIPTHMVRQISYEDSTVYVNLTRADIERAGETEATAAPSAVTAVSLD